MCKFQHSHYWWKFCAAILLLGIALWPQPAAAVVCSSPTNTSVLTGTGLTCALAQANLSTITLSEANSICISQGYGGVCTSYVTNVFACSDVHDGAGHYWYAVTGYRTFTCTICTASNPCS